MSDRRVEYAPLSEIRSAPRNAKRHDKELIGAAIADFGFAELPLVDERTGRLVAGHGRIADLVAKYTAGAEAPDGVRVDDAGEWLVPVIRGWSSRDDAHAEAYVLVSNQSTIKGGWDDAALAEALSAMAEADLLALTGFTDDDLARLLDEDSHGGGNGGLTDPDDIPDAPAAADARTKPGDLWLLGPHRVLCGDSTSAADVREVLGELDEVALILADPPYGMGKEADGVANDNLYGPKLDAFQMNWVRAWLPVWADNGSAYVWGNAPDLWRLWWVGGLADTPDLMVRNEIVWNKGSAPGMASEGSHCYPTASERCLFLMRGEQFLGNQNKDAYWPGYEPLRVWLVAERDRIGWTSKDVNQLTGTTMAGHWFTQSQFMPISEKHYQVLADAAAGRAFTKPYRDLFDEMFPDVKSGGNAHRRDLSAAMRESRTTFDGTHDAMTDVWEFGRVIGEERFGHATPKPVAMIEREIRTSSESGDVVAVPFGGTGPDLIAAHRTGRIAVVIELEPRWVDVICRRYQEHTGEQPILAATGELVDFTK